MLKNWSDEENHRPIKPGTTRKYPDGPAVGWEARAQDKCGSYRCADPSQCSCRAWADERAHPHHNTRDAHPGAGLVNGDFFWMLAYNRSYRIGPFASYQEAVDDASNNFHGSCRAVTITIAQERDIRTFTLKHNG